MKHAQTYIQRLTQGLSRIPADDFEKITTILLSAYDQNKQIFICGNGGSAATASHFACDLGKGTLENIHDAGEKRLRVISLTDNMATFSALANDIGYEHVFSQQLRNLLQQGDVVIGISASGNSLNVINALVFAKEKGATTIGFLGFSGGNMKKFCDHFLHFEENNYQRVEDAHLIFQHIITSMIAEKKREKEITPEIPAYTPPPL